MKSFKNIAFLPLKHPYPVRNTSGSTLRDPFNRDRANPHVRDGSYCRLYFKLIVAEMKLLALT